MEAKYEKLVITDYLLLDEIKLNDDKTIHRRNYKIPHTMEAIKVKPLTRKLKAGHAKSRTKNITKARFLASLFLHNEISACNQKVIDREGMLRSMRREFPAWPARQSRNYFNRWSTHRHLYNQGRMHDSQPLPLLYAWAWTVDGYIRHSKTLKQYLSYEYCRRHLLKAKFIDPRFFTKEEITEIREKEEKNDESQWNIPSLKEIELLEKQVGKPLYNSIQFPPGYEKGCVV